MCLSASTTIRFVVASKSVCSTSFMMLPSVAFSSPSEIGSGVGIYHSLEFKRLIQPAAGRPSEPGAGPYKPDDAAPPALFQACQARPEGEVSHCPGTVAEGAGAGDDTEAGAGAPFSGAAAFAIGLRAGGGNWRGFEPRKCLHSSCKLSTCAFNAATSALSA